jgi:hypothetical protein
MAGDAGSYLTGSEQVKPGVARLHDVGQAAQRIRYSARGFVRLGLFRSLLS